MLLFYEDEPDTIGMNETCQSNCTRNAFFGGIDSLEKHKSHAFIPVPQCSHTSVVESLKIHNASTWTYCGPLLPAESELLPPSFQTWVADTLNHPSILLERLLPVLSFLQDYLSAAGTHHYWLTIRATRPTHDYDTPRWHTDEDFFAANPEAGDFAFGASNGSNCWKLATTLVGPPTLFLKNNTQALEILRRTKTHERAQIGDHTCTSIRCVGCATYADTVRQSLAQSLAQEEVESPAPGEIAVFRIGAEYGGVHSEPKCDTDRIFVNVIPGTEKNLKMLMKRFGMSFPRAWCLGNPVGFIPSDEKEHLLCRRHEIL